MVEREERKRGIDRRDDRDHHSRRRHYRREREPSPKKLRRDRERDEKRNRDSGCANPSDRDLIHGNRLREAERSTRDVKSHEAKRSIDGIKDGSETKVDGASDANRIHSDPKEFARSKICFQHDEHGSSGQVVQIQIRHDADNTRSDPKERKSGEKSNDKTEIEAKHPSKKKDESGWGHDGFFQLESDPPSAKKIPPEPELGLKKPNKEQHNSSDLAENCERKPDTRRDDRFGRRDDRIGTRENLSMSRRDDRFGSRWEGGFGRGNRNGNGNAVRRNDYRDRFGGRGPPRGGGGARFGDGNRLRQISGAQTDRWKHDKYEEANKSPTNEEDQIAKVEALLAL